MSATQLSSAALYALVENTLGANATGSITAGQIQAVLNAIIASFPNTVDGTSAYSSIGTIESGLWEGTPVALSYGGTGADLIAASGAVVYSTNSQLALTAASAVAGLPLLSGNMGAPAWGAATVFGTNGAGGGSITLVGGGSITLEGATSGALTISVPAVVGAASALQLPASSGVAGQILWLSGVGTATWSAVIYPAAVLAGQVLAAASANAIAGTYAPVLGVNGVAGGALTLEGSTSGAVAIGVPAAAGSTTFNLPGTNGAVGARLGSDGAGNTSWSASTWPSALTTVGTVLAIETTNVVVATATPAIGQNSGTAGALTLNGSGATGSVALGVQSGSLSANVTFNLPISNGASNQVLATDGAGNTSWLPPSALTVDTGSAALYIAGDVL